MGAVLAKPRGVSVLESPVLFLRRKGRSGPFLDPSHSSQGTFFWRLKPILLSPTPHLPGWQEPGWALLEAPFARAPPPPSAPSQGCGEN